MSRSAALALLILAAPAFGQEAPPPGESVLRTFAEAHSHKLDEEFKEFLASPLDSAGVTTDACSVEDALKRARGWLEGNGATEAVAALKAAGGKTAHLSGIAGAAAAKGKLALTIAALLEVAAREPRNAGALANLAAALSSVGLCAEAVAIAETAEPLAGKATGGMGLPVRCIALNALGHARIRQGRAGEAVKPLREAVALGGALASEASRNLAFALKKAGEEEESKKFFLAAFWRRPVANPVCTGGKGRKKGDLPRQPFDEGVSTSAPARLIFDLSHGKEGKLPTFKHPQNIGQVKAFVKFHDREKKAILEALARLGPVRRPQVKSLADRRAQAVYHLLQRVEHDPEIEPLWVAMEQGREELGRKQDELFKTYIKRSREISDAIREEKAQKKAIRALSNELIGQANGPCNTYETLVRNYWKAARKYMSGMASNIKSPDWHAYAVAQIDIMMHAGIWGHRLLSPIDSTYRSLSAGYSDETEEGLEVPEKPGAEGEDIPACPEGLQGCGVELAAGPLSFSMSCESVGVELSSAGFLKGFVSMEAKWSGEMTVYAGTKLELDGKGILPGFTAHDGFYVSGDKNGITDAGFRVGFEGYKEMGGMKVKATLDQMDFSLMPRVR